MSKVQTLRVFVNQRLTAAAEEIFELFERTIAEYEEQLCRQNKLLDAVFKPEVQLHRADVQLLLVSEEEDPLEQQEWSASLDQEDPPELPHIKEEQEELWTNQEGEQLEGPEEADIIKSTFTPVPVKSEEDDEEKLQSSQLHQTQTEEMKTEADGEDCGGPEPARDLNPRRHLQPDTDDRKSNSSDSETDNSCDWEETSDHQSGFNSLGNNEAPGSDVECDAGKTSVDSSDCATSSDYKGDQQRDSGVQTGLKSLSCSVCGKEYPQKKSLTDHMRIHSERKCYSCSICKKSFQWRRNVVAHMRIHTGENLFTCSVCGKGFAYRSQFTLHLRVHTGEKPFTCSVCRASFSHSSALKRHMGVHTGEKPFSCSICGQKYARKVHLTQHLIVHTGEKPFSCSVCGARFTRLAYLKQHKCVGENRGETEEMKSEAHGEDCGGPQPARNFKPDCAKSFGHKGDQQKHSGLETELKCFSCTVCGKKYSREKYLLAHMKLHSKSQRISCSFCNKGFRFRGEVERHMRVHTGEKPFSCSICGKGFRDKSHVTVHMRIHTGEKPFTCSVCKTSFRDSSGLKTHMKGHTGEKPFSCSFCGRKYTQKISLTKHMTVHTGEKPFSGRVGQRFTRHAHTKVHKCVGESSGETEETKTETDEEHCGGSDSARNFNPECATSFAHKEDQERDWDEDRTETM